ncbi:hypothetical protein [Vibrio parahaemolyticus]|uniref:hypothetical protein n=1 Tax=Vibrio parahaemolyticus TaxID=670 RepID=UPI00067A9D3B|nr:hypothetical protein [Vibrio parahaemolyticus]
MNQKLVKMIEDAGLEVSDVSHIIEEAQAQVAVSKDHPILMSRDNHYGWKLEELVEKLRGEIMSKSLNIAEDMSFEAQTVKNNNFQILGLFMQVEALQRQSFVVMSKLGKDQGPKGVPRIGKDSEQDKLANVTMNMREVILAAEEFGLVRTEDGTVITGALASEHGVMLVKG